jgi:catechol 2,3-dioxygenase-like lactoylglutathione lyase family enzyme
MNQQLVHISLLVNDYDVAIDFFTRKLNFDLTEDTVLSETKRWVLVTPRGNSGCSLLLAKASGDEQRSRIGNQTGGRVFLFLRTDDIQRDFEAMSSNGIEFVTQPHKESYGTVAVFKDMWGNLWDLIQYQIKM